MTDQTRPDLSGKTVMQVIPGLDSGGAENTTIEIAEAIVRAGGRALVVSSGGRMESRLHAVGGELVRMNVTSKNPLSVCANAGKITAIVRERCVDLIHARSRAPGWSAWTSAKRTHIPFVTTYHGIYSGRYGIKRHYNSVMARGTAIIANSEWTARHITSVHGVAPGNITVIPRGVDPVAFDPAAIAPSRKTALSSVLNLAVDDDRTILFLPGRLTRWKGQLITVRALALLDSTERARLHLIMAGDAKGHEQYVSELNQAITSHDLSSHVSIVEHIDDMAAAYSLADIVLAPSTRPEAFGRVAIEASAMARPVIVANHGGQRETVLDEQTGIRVTPACETDLARAIRALVTLTPDERKSMGMRGRRLVQDNFTTAQLQQATLRVYSRLLQATSLGKQPGKNGAVNQAH